MKQLFQSLAVAGLAILTLAQAAQAGAQDFVLYNRTGVDIAQVFVAPTSSESWEENIMGSSNLLNGADIAITFDDRETESHWDIMVTDHEGNALYWRDIDLIQASEVILEEDGVARIK